MVNIWKMGNFYKVYSEDTALIRQLANAQDCKIGAEYYFRGRLVGLDAILPLCPKNGRRIVRVLNSSGFGYREKKPNLTGADILTVSRGT